MQLSEELLRPDPVLFQVLFVLGVPAHIASKAKGRFSVVTWSTELREPPSGTLPGTRCPPFPANTQDVEEANRGSCGLGRGIYGSLLIWMSLQPKFSQSCRFKSSEQFFPETPGVLSVSCPAYLLDHFKGGIECVAGAPVPALVADMCALHLCMYLCEHARVGTCLTASLCTRVCIYACF